MRIDFVHFSKISYRRWEQRSLEGGLCMISCNSASSISVLTKKHDLHLAWTFVLTKQRPVQPVDVDGVVAVESIEWEKRRLHDVRGDTLPVGGQPLAWKEDREQQILGININTHALSFIQAQKRSLNVGFIGEKVHRVGLYSWGFSIEFISLNGFAVTYQ